MPETFKPQSQEGNPEQFPAQEEIRSVFETILQGKEYKEVGVLSNEGGVYVYEIEIVLENGEKILYIYQKAKNDYRDKSLPDSAQFSASIHTMELDGEGIPCGGTTVANYLDGKWEYVS
ncbi:MAG: hypothetical protein WC835_02990 [Candidatus Paceibacterota bacterium]|jgi:hypothetical protein